MMFALFRLEPVHELSQFTILVEQVAVLKVLDMDNVEVSGACMVEHCSGAFETVCPVCEVEWATGSKVFPLNIHND
jgi:hypothetical protein